MYKDQVYFYKTENVRHNCLKVYNEAGDELSLSGDDSCGAMRHLGRLSLAVFAKGGNWMTGSEAYNITPVKLLECLAKHLGYTLTKSE